MKKSRILALTGVVTVAALALGPAAAVAQEPSNPAIVRDGRDWHLRGSLSSGPADISFRYGRPGDTALLCDWNGDGEQTPGIVRYGSSGSPIWMLRNSRSTGVSEVNFAYGRQGDRAVCGDWNADGTETAGIVREDANGRFHWHLRNSNTQGPADVSFVYGRDLSAGELPPTWPIVGDWNGDGATTPGIVRGHDDGEMHWLLRNSNTSGNSHIDFWYYDQGVWGDHLELHVPIVGDWNGDGMDGPGVTRARDGANPQWLLRNDRSAGTADHVFRYGRHLDATLTWD